MDASVAPASDELEPAAESPPMTLVRHMLNVIEQQQAQLAALREANAALRAQLADAHGGLGGQPMGSQTAANALLPLATAFNGAFGAADERPLAAAARLTPDEALASLVDLASAREYEPGLVVARVVGSTDGAGAKRPHALTCEPAALRCVAARPSLSEPHHPSPRVDEGKVGWAMTALAPAMPLAAVSEAAAPWRRCRVCGTTDSPKWRQRNTLCNACGLRTAKTVRGTAGKPQPHEVGGGYAHALGGSGGPVAHGRPPPQPVTFGVAAQQLAPLSSHSA